MGRTLPQLFDGAVAGKVRHGEVLRLFGRRHRTYDPRIWNAIAVLVEARVFAVFGTQGSYVHDPWRSWRSPARLMLYHVGHAAIGTFLDITKIQFPQFRTLMHLVLHLHLSYVTGQRCIIHPSISECL